jgi:hypothetical protein
MQPRRPLTPPLTALILLNLALFCLMRLPPSQLEQSVESARAWRKLYSYAEACQRPLNSPTVVPVMIQRGLWPLDSGHTEYFFGSQPIAGMRWFGASHDVVLELGEHYLSSMRSAVAHQEFDCIMLARYSGWPRDLPLERGEYRLADTMVVAMPQTAQTWQMDIWVPAPE